MVRLCQQFQDIQDDFNKNSGEESTLSSMPSQTLDEKVQMKKFAKKYKIAIYVKPSTYVK